MASAASKQPSADLTINDSTEGNPMESGDELTMGQDEPKGNNKGTGAIGGRRVLSTCLPKSKEIPALTIKSKGLESHIQYMRDHALIAKFVGIWQMEKNLIRWINH